MLRAAAAIKEARAIFADASIATGA